MNDPQEEPQSTSGRGHISSGKFIRELISDNRRTVFNRMFGGRRHKAGHDESGFGVFLIARQQVRVTRERPDNADGFKTLRHLLSSSLPL
ncbi:hypothetical protein EYF80_010220 [Liparis tanakae]|uniref:Uncharacterized protein n=1 Tax=Liparis tanakae TaxID=230148 RepID=A0A4Z2IPP2_9TELE|nr:hypothetical protein EYF80_010220 [Liparis tanakae]